MTRERRFALEARAAAVVAGARAPPARAARPSPWAAALGPALADLDPPPRRRSRPTTCATPSRTGTSRAGCARPGASTRTSARSCSTSCGCTASRRSDLLALVVEGGREHVDAALRRGRGVVYVHRPHRQLGVVRRRLRAGSSGRVGVVARPLDNPALDARLVRLPHVERQHRDLQAPRPAQDILRLLRRARASPSSSTRTCRSEDGIFVDVLRPPRRDHDRGRRPRRQDGLRASCPARELLPDGRYTVRLRAGRSTGRATGDREADIARLTQELTTEIEGWVRAAPRAVAVDAPALEDAARGGGGGAVGPSGDAEGRWRLPSGSSCARRTGSATSCCRWPPLRDLRRNFPARAPRGAGPRLGGRPLRRGGRGRRGARARGARARTRTRCAARSTRRVLLPNSFGTALAALAGAASPSAGATRRTAARLLLTRAPRVPGRGPGPTARCTTIARCSPALGLRVSAAPDVSLALPAGVARAPRGRAARLGDDGPWLGRQPRRLLRHGQALAPGALRAPSRDSPGRRSARASRSWAGPRSGPSARPSPPRCARPPRVLCGETTAPRARGRARAAAPPRHQRLRAHAPRGRPRRARGGRLRLHRLARDRIPSGSAPPHRARARRSARPAGCASARSTIAACARVTVDRVLAETGPRWGAH